MLTRPDESVSSIARLLGVSRSTLYKHAPEATGRPRAVQLPAAAIEGSPDPDRTP
ncbi:hypothetical protein [Actinomadura macra]|uniref:hypothetical protein n=1 Tax=Actinomadura macra TaxID=46164 RepID=UPI0024809B95|nr:hypothetical protein [Actinomadura macra]